MTDACGPNPGGEPAAVRRLDEATVEHVAAGEVVTRPARVVGELVDNALDAGATAIEVAVAGDGTEEIRVADDGHGMARGDAARAVRRHTTSKLRDGETPTGVATLGFRGEALPAIAEAARLELVTNDGGEVGTRIVVDGGTAGGRDAGVDPEVSDAARARGTTATVRDLFAGRPARRDALAGEAAEFGRIGDLVARYALARPAVAFELTHDGRETLTTPGTGYADALMGVYDRETASRSTAFETSADLPGRAAGRDDEAVAASIEGVLAYPSIDRASREHVRVSVDGRPVRNDALARAVRDGYGSLLPDGREPVAAVDVGLPPRAVDPNVHPAKAEVGLRASDAVADAVETAVEDALTGADLRRKAEVATDLEAELEAKDGASPFDDVTVIGQYRDLYLLCEAGEELLVVDAHAAHERVNYERLRAAFSESSVPSAALDPAETLSLSPATASAAAEHAETLAALGFDVEPFGGTTVRLRAAPAPFGRVADADALRDVLDELAAGESPTDRREALLRDLACHPSVKAGDALDADEARGLLDRLGECERPFACPHGRPTVLSIDAATLAGGFDRRH